MNWPLSDSEGLLLAINNGQAALQLLFLAPVYQLEPRLGTRVSARAARYMAWQEAAGLLKDHIKISQVASVSLALVCGDTISVVQVARVLKYSHTLVEDYGCHSSMKRERRPFEMWYSLKFSMEWVRWQTGGTCALKIHAETSISTVYREGSQRRLHIQSVIENDCIRWCGVHGIWRGNCIVSHLCH